MEEDQGSCTGTGYTNWTMDQLPGPGDTAIIGPTGMPVVLVSPHTTVDSIQAERSLEVFPNLTLEGTSSTFHDLILHPGILLANGAIQVSGNSALNRSIGAMNPRGADPPLTVTADGTVNLNGMTLTNGTAFVNNGTATVDADDLFINNGSFTNNNSLTLMAQQDVLGDQQQFENADLLTIQPGTAMNFDPEYVQTGGVLRVYGGTANLRSRVIHLEGGGITIAEGGVVNVQSPFVATIDGSFDGLSYMNGLGAFVLREEMDVLQALSVQLSDFVLRGGRLNVEDQFTNNGTMRLWSGILAGSGLFLNRNSVLVKDGSGVISVQTQNKGVIEIENQNLAVTNDALVSNLFILAFLGTSGELSSDTSARLQNLQLFAVKGDDSKSHFEVSARFKNESDGEVRAIEGQLNFTGNLENLNLEILSTGKWVAETGGRIDFPTLVHKLGFGADVCICGGAMPDLNFLEEILFGASLTVTVDWGPLGDLTLTTDGRLTTVAGPLRAPGDSSAGGEGPTPPVLTIPNLINVSGVVQPGTVGELGTMQLVGNYQQQADGMLAVDHSLAGADLLSVDGDAELAGSLEIRRLDEVSVATTFTVLTVTNGMLTGTFDQIRAEDEYSLEYFADHVEVTLDKIIGPMLENGFE